jgi:nucleotide-binding universal stress UspA family protein
LRLLPDPGEMPASGPLAVRLEATVKILLPVDGSELSLHEVRFALRLVDEGLKARFVLANVQEPASFYELVTAPDPAMRGEVTQAVGLHLLEAAERLLREAGIEFDTDVVAGDPAHAMLDLIEEHACDLVILGTRAQGLLMTALQGSVSQSLIHDSPVPVLLVKPPVEPEAPDDEA